VSKQYEHIQQIRKEKYWLDDSSRRGEQNPLLKDLQQSINKLSRDLYRKDSHFLLELIQNAEDNDYECDNPTLSFTLIKEDPTNSNASGGALVISNNEVGFSEDNMKAMCSIGSSFKDKLKGYIGEKGIGFKSVFKVTKSPYIYSNGYQVRFQDEINEIGLGYIVPEWVENVPKVATIDHTTIILPLNNGKVGFSEVSRMMKEFTPETILFLSKIRQLRFFVEGEYDISISKSVEKEHVVNLTISTTVDEQTSVIHKEHLLYTKNILRPADLLVEGREEVLDRDVTISFPIGNTANDGAIYAYLPVLENTGMPFILNADFLVPGSRDSIKEDEPWNTWLLNQIPDLFVEAFVTLSKRSKHRYELFRHIPIEANIKTSFLEPVAKQITEMLSRQAIVPTEPRGKLAFPKESKSSRDFRKVTNGQKLPGALKDRLIAEELQNTVRSEVLQAIGINTITSNDIKTYIGDIEWISSIGFEGLITLYQFLVSRKKQYEEFDLRQYKIVPIKEKKKIRYSCYTDQPIYFEATKSDRDVLSEKPDCIKAPIRFLDNRFYDLLIEKKDIQEWMTVTLCVFPFSIGEYAVAVSEWFKANHKDLDDEQFVDVSNYILDHVAKDIDLADFPVLLSTGKRILISIGKKTHSTLVTPAGLDPETGWKAIFITEADSQHLQVLSDLYLRDDSKTPRIIELTRATKYPPLTRKFLNPMHYGWNGWIESEEYSDEEKRLLAEAQSRSATSRLYEIYVSKVIKPSSLTGNISKETALALLNWLNGRYRTANQPSIHSELSNEIGWYNYSQYTRSAESGMFTFLRKEAWLPTTKGLQRPSHVFVRKPGVYDVLGDAVPYLEKEINPYVFEFLGIRDELTSKEIFSYLLDLSQSGQGSIDLASRVYKALSILEIDNDAKDQLLSANCIAVEEIGGVKWVTAGLCIWNDRSILFADQFYYLSKLYPKLRDFFVDKLGVALDVGDEHFCALWQDIQFNDDLETEFIESKLTMLYDTLRPLFDSTSSGHSDWWQSFLKEAKLWSIRKRFVTSTSIYIPDDGNLKDMFKDEQVDYLWYPNKGSYSHWQSLHSAFRVRSLKDSVSISLKDVEYSVIVNPAKYLTRSAKTLILVWLREKHPERFQLLVDKGIVNEFVRTTEYRSDKLIISYELDGRVVEASSDAFMDLSNGKAYYVATACKPAIAAEICRALSVNEHDEDLESWIKGVLGSDEADLQAELKQKNWQITDEISQLLSEDQDSSDSTDENSSEDTKGDALDDDPDIDESGEDLNPDGGIDPDEEGKRPDGKGRSDGYGSESHKRGKSRKRPSEPDADDADEVGDDVDDDDSEESIEDAFGKALNSDDKPKKDDGDYEDSGKTHNSDSRYDQEFNKAADRNKRSRKQTERFRILRRRILDGPDSQVREMLYRWYSGKCQICGSTFYQSNGKPFFVSHCLVLRKVSDAADTVGNAVCLCANHFAQMLHGRVKSPDVLEQLGSIDPTCESFALNLTFDGVPHTIRYNQKHAIALKAFYESLKEDSEEL
jgi:hypothetical protein